MTTIIPPCGVDTSGGQADWDLSIGRYYFVDNVNGSDLSVGYIDAPLGTVFTPSQTGPVALKTREELSRRIPRDGANRIVIALFKFRSDDSVYLNKAGLPDFFDNNYHGYYRRIFRASDHTNSVNDRIDGGYINDPLCLGPNVDGSWTVSGAMVGFGLSVSAGVLPAETLAGGRKLQFKGNVTAAARTLGNTFLIRNSNTSFDTARAQTLAAGDEFFIKKQGVLFTNCIEVANGGDGPIGPDTSILRGPVVYGIGFTEAFQWYMGPMVPMGIEFRNSVNLSGEGTLAMSSLYRDETNTTRTIINGFNFQSGVGIAGITSLTSSASPSFLFSYIRGTCQYNRPNTQDYIFGSGCVFVGNLRVLSQVSMAAATDFTTFILGVIGGINTADHPTVLKAGANLHGSMNVSRVSLVGSTLGIKWFGTGVAGALYTVTGALAAGVSVLDLSAAIGAKIRVDTATCIATPGAGGFDVLINGGLSTTFASLATSSTTDTTDNTVFGAAGSPMRKALFKFSGVHVGAVGAATSYLADAGNLVGGLMVVPVQYPMPACRTGYLRVIAPVNASLAAITVTVYKNGVATTVQATIGAGVVTAVVDLTHEAQFAANGLLDLRADSTGGGAGNLTEISATLEVY